jgi:O-antigen ligase
MSGGVAATRSAVQASQLWRRMRNPAIWMPAADMFAVLTAASLPWSTSLAGGFALMWLGSAALIADYPAYLRSLKQPICALPLALFALAAVGMVWSEASWAARLHALAPYAKFLLLPGLFQHFQRSPRGMAVFAAFLVSSTLMMALSCITAFEPGFTLKPLDERMCGVFVKNSIDQGQEFSLCAVVLAYPIMTLLQQGKRWQAGILIAIALGLVVNMVFVIASRTAMVTAPLLLGLFALRYLNWRGTVVLGVAILIVVSAWAVTPPMCRAVETLSRDVTLYTEKNIPTSAGLRLEYWKKAIQFIREAPFAGHGTGSIRGLFEKAATGDHSEATGHVVANPHNQTLHTAIQWGIVGLVPLYLMWLSHLLLFRGEGFVAWIGLAIVAQNMLSSLFNSHIVDFHASWMYVLGVGVAGGMVLARQRKARAEGTGP